MEIDAFLADSVDTVNGKIYAHGAGWNMIFAGEVPARHQRVGLGILIRVPYTATNQEHKLEIRLEDSDGELVSLGDVPGQPGEKLTNFGTNFNVGRPPTLAPGEDQIVPVSMNINGLLLERADIYHFVLEIDGTEVKRLPLRLVHQPVPGPI